MSVALNGSSAFLRISSNVLSYTTDYTMMGWFYGDTAQTAFGTLFDISFSSTSNDILNNTGTNELEGYSDGPTFAEDATGPTLSTNAWHHVVFRATGTVLNLYVDGAVASPTVIVTRAAGYSSRTAATQLNIGNDRFSEFYQGSVFNVKVWQESLSLEEIEAEYACMIPKKFTNLYGWWPLWDASDLKDYSGNGNDFTGTATTSSGLTPSVPYCEGSQSYILIPAAGGGAPRRIFLIG